MTAIKGLMVHPHHIHGRVRRGRRYDHPLGASLEVRRASLDGREHARRLYNVLGSSLGPRNLGRVFAIWSAMVIVDGTN